MTSACGERLATFAILPIDSERYLMIGRWRRPNEDQMTGGFHAFARTIEHPRRLHGGRLAMNWVGCMSQACVMPTFRQALHLKECSPIGFHTWYAATDRPGSS